MRIVTKVGIAGLCAFLGGCAGMQWAMLPLNPVPCKGSCTIEVPIVDSCPTAKPDRLDIRLDGSGTHTITWTLPENSQFVFANESNNFKGPIYLRGDNRTIASDPANRTDRTRVRVLRAGKALEVKLDRLDGESSKVQYFLNLEHATRRYPGRPGSPPGSQQGEWCEIDPWIVDR